MRWLSQLRMRFLMLFGRANAAASLDEELRFHIDRQIAENLAAGMSPDEARFAALRTFGNPALLREQTRDTWSWSSLESLLRDVRYGFRTLRRTPGFTAIAIIVMALGIGANVALFTVVRSVLLKPLPFADPDRLVMLYERSYDWWRRPAPITSSQAASTRSGRNKTTASVTSPWLAPRITASPLRAANCPKKFTARQSPGICSRRSALSLPMVATSTPPTTAPRQTAPPS